MNSLRIAFAVLLSSAILAPTFAVALMTTRVTPIITTSCVNGAPQIKLTWPATTGAISYSLFRNKASTYWSNISSKQTSTSYTDKDIISGLVYQYQEKTTFASKVAYSYIVSATAPMCSTITTPAANETSFTGYITGYGWPDNTPASAEISNPVIHQSAGGTGTYTDPITIAVGHSIINGKDILDYAPGTKFYIPALRRYFIVEDTCGDGSAPQNGPCHTGYEGHIWLDAWVGGTGANSSSVLSCEDVITGLHKIIRDPSSNYKVVSGAVFGSICSSLFSDTVITN